MRRSHIAARRRDRRDALKCVALSALTVALIATVVAVPALVLSSELAALTAVIYGLSTLLVLIA